jgi:FkbM family methyltransferase
MHELPSAYAKHAHWIGFEPNPAEYNKIITYTTKARQSGFIPPQWKRETVKEVALWNEPGVRKLYVASNVAYTSLMGEVIPEIAERIFLDFGGAHGVGVAPMGSTVKKTVSIEEVNCERLDDIVDTKNTVDYFKVDVEGAETLVFEGAKSLLESGRILFIRTEFFCVPYYESHPLFGHQHVLLHEHGFRLLNVDFGATRYTRCKSRIPKLVDKGLLYVGDALYALDPDRVKISDIDLQRMGLVSLTFGLRSFGLSVLRDAKLLSAMQLQDIEDALSRVPFRRRLRRSWENFPAMFAEFIYTGRLTYRGHHWRYEA